MNSIRKWSWLVIVVTVFSLIVMVGCKGGAVGGNNLTASNAPLAVKVLDVGQGDAILIRAKDQIVLVDTGDVPTKDELVKMLKNQGITTIDKLIITHPHADHIGGATAVLQAFTVKQIYDSGQKTTTNLYKKYLTQIQKKNIPFTVVSAGMTIDLGNDMVLAILAPDKSLINGTESDLNNNSIVAKLVYQNFSMLLTGDAESESEARMLKKDAAILKSVVLKSGHHGSRTSSSVPFLRAVSPEAVIISLGANNEYHHPHPSTIKKYQDKKIAIYRTDKDGTVTVSSDGKNYTITKER